MKLALIALLVATVQNSFAASDPKWPLCSEVKGVPGDSDPRLTRESLGPYSGVWEGALPGIPAEQLNMTCIWTPRIRLEFGQHTAQIQYWSDGQWETLTSDASLQVTATNAVVTVIRAPDNREWVETWAFVLTKKDRCTILATWVRMVNNFKIPGDGNFSKFGMVSAGELHQVMP